MRGYRLKQIEQYILENDTVSLEDLVEHFDISINTVRRDIAELVQQGNIEKIYGGVRTRQKSPLIPFEQRHNSNPDLKETVGRLAAELVEDGDVIFVDSGTTTMQLIGGLQQRRHVTIVTGSLSAVVEALPHRNLNVISLTGQLDRKTNSFIGANTLRALDSFNFKKAFMAATGLSLQSGITNSSLLEYEIKARAMVRSEQAVLLIDSTKFGVSSLTTYAQIEQFHKVVTDRSPAREYLQAFAEHGVELVCPKE